MPILTEKNLNEFNVNRHEHFSDKCGYRKEDYTSKQEAQKPSYPDLKTEDLKLDGKTRKNEPTVKEVEKAEHVEHSIDDDEGDKTVIAATTGEKLDGAKDHACACGKKEADGKVKDVVGKGDDGVAASVEEKLEESRKEPDGEKKGEAEEAKTDEKADAALKAEENAEVKHPEKEVKSDEAKEAKKEK
ncbi:hypothetical protein AC579_3726 [Pseudocercospora musae]|uniref:Uncharacterized protein n=1 Tax=Pseudocercospora musae TaxID=113226 RepID=A0A139I1R1_9PEZI|nr:hypothetical protein AC579_3726 [Pseudocercospora musae]